MNKNEPSRIHLTVATCRAETAYPSGAPECLVGFVLLGLPFCELCFVRHCLSFCPYSFANVFFDLQLLITLLVFSKLSYMNMI